MDDAERAVLRRLPLAEGSLRMWGHIAGDEVLQGAFEAGRGRSYEGMLTFPELVGLFSDAITSHGGSGRRSMLRSKERDELSVSPVAVYAKLRRVPPAVSEEMLRRCTARLVELMPERGSGLPRSLHGFTGVVLDGQTVKNLDRRLTATRGVKGGLLGGRSLVALSLKTGLIQETVSHEDGYTNEASLVPELMPRVRRTIKGPRLYVADRQFCYLMHMTEFTAEPRDAFILRHRADVRFEPDALSPAISGKDARSRPFTDRLGTVHAQRPERSMPARLITLRHGQETIGIVTNLLDRGRYPAADLLEVYLSRWGIERVFQQVTEVFGLSHLIGSSPRASLFQFALCALWHNIIQAMKVLVAPGGDIPDTKVSGENLFDDVKRQLIACDEVLTLSAAAAALEPEPSPEMLRERLITLLRPAWTTRWIRSPPKKTATARPHSGKGWDHASTYRLIQKHQQRKGKNRP